MRSKQEILAELQEGLRTGTVTEADIHVLLAHPSEPVTSPSITPQAVELDEKPSKVSAVDIMFYIAGLVLFSAIMSMIVQTWNDGNVIVQILLSGGIGLGFWAVSYYLIIHKSQSDIRRGLVNSLLLTGSLLIIVGGYIVMNKAIDGFDQINFMPAAIMLLLLAALHISFDRLVKRDLILHMGILLGVAAFPSLIFSFLQAAGPGLDLWVLTLVATAGLLAYASRVAVKVYSDRREIERSFDGFATFVALMSMYVASYGKFGVWWTTALVAVVIGIFYLSIVAQNKQLLGNASFFLVLTIITISFKYFSGFGITTSLIISTIGLLGTATMAATINKRYFKQPAKKQQYPSLSSQHRSRRKIRQRNLLVRQYIQKNPNPKHLTLNSTNVV